MFGWTVFCLILVASAFARAFVGGFAEAAFKRKTWGEHASALAGNIAWAATLVAGMYWVMPDTVMQAITNM